MRAWRHHIRSTLDAMRMLICALAMAVSFGAAAQEMFKCKDARGKITYSGRPCAEQGLTDAGEVKGRANITPAIQPPVFTPSAPAAAAPEAPKPEAAAAPQAPERRCFVVKTAKGNVTRCNDVPPEETK